MSDSSNLVTDQSLIRRFLEQPPELSAQVRAALLADGGNIQLYAWADRDAALQLNGRWVVVTDSLVVIASEEDAPSAWQRFPRDDIRLIREDSGSSGGWLGLYGGEEQLLVGLSFTNRQKKGFEQLRALLQQQLDGRPVTPVNPDQIYAEAVASRIRDAQATVAKNQMAVIWRLLSYFKPYRREVVVGSVAAVLMTLLNLAPPYFTKYLLDQVIRPVEEGKLRPESVTATAAGVIALLGLIFVIREFCLWLRLRKMAFLGELVAHDLRQEIYAHLQKLPLGFFSKKQTGGLITRVSSDTDRLWEFLAFGVVEASLSLLMLAGLGGVLIWMDWQLGLLMTLPVPLFLAAYYFHGKDINRKFLRAWRNWSDVTAVLSDTIPGMRVVKSFNQEDREKVRFDKRNDIALTSFNSVHQSWTTFWPLLMFAFHVILLAVWAMALARVLGLWGAPLTLGTFVAFLLYMGLFFYPLEVIGQITRMMNRAVSSAHRVFEVIDTQPPTPEDTEAVRLDPLKGEIRFEHVSFSYDGVRQILRGIHFTIPPGEMVGLVGPSGAGKSTIINLIARFYEISSGRILIDGVDLRQVDVGHYRRQVGMVQQEPFLFHGTLLDNIRYGLPDADLAKVIAAARAANAHDFICRLPLGYETVVGERGHTLSGGERQRISIARAILHDPKILILDEATSNVDTETERNIQEALDRLVQGRTVVAIAHRLSTLQRASRLLVIKEGALVEEGTHSELLAHPNGLYRKLHDMQQQLHANFAV
ncbi:MAG: ABC transporter ATP-binding protein [Chthoniobacterales bacterium]|nr:ABC transporter ATP-binding protein [Chthoniobacterales bacterium]